MSDSWSNKLEAVAKVLLMDTATRFVNIARSMDMDFEETDVMVCWHKALEAVQREARAEDIHD